ncbi:MAG: arginine--tRNA ligase [Ignavibacteria bacterium]|nr:arginine--tRNA ligase [Ignavibacteria bacterium]
MKDNLKKYLEEEILSSLDKLGIARREIVFDKPKEEKFGDYSTNIAMLLAKELKQPPRKIASDILERMKIDKAKISNAEIAGAGFLNFFAADPYCIARLEEILNEGSGFGRSAINSGLRANLEWISANPTGPLHTGHGRAAALGKAIANLLEWTGYDVTREYYYNDAGNQMNNLAKSVYARYMQIMDPGFEFPDEGYVGDYVKEIAADIYGRHGDKFRDNFDSEYFKSEGENHTFALIKKTLERMGIEHDVFFNESSLYDDGTIDRTIEELKSRSLAYEQDGAVWLRMPAEEGFQKDKVIVKSTGEPTYRLPDIAYHIDKVNRGFDLIVDIFGSDHGDTYKEVLYGVKCLGHDESKIKVIIHQMVTFRMGDESVKMSKRSDKVYSLDELMDDIGADATQFFFIMRGANTHLDFDISLAKERSEKNPVYYLQYAYARICGILRNAEVKLAGDSVKEKWLEALPGNEDEIRLIKVIDRFPEEVEQSAASLEPHKIINYLNELAESFHRFYHNNRVVDPDKPDVSRARLQLCRAAGLVFRNGFEIIGVSAPERM